jgi:hypothetical protein
MINIIKSAAGLAIWLASLAVTLALIVAAVLLALVGLTYLFQQVF